MLMRMLDEQYTRTPFYGARKMAAWLQTQGYPVERKRVRRLLQLMGLEAIYPKPRTSPAWARQSSVIRTCSEEEALSTATRSGVVTSPTSECLEGSSI